MDSTYAEREYKVLRAIYEMSDRRPEKWVMISELATTVEMTSQELNPILANLEDRKGLIGSVDAAVWMLPAGMEEIEKTRNHPTEPTAHFPANIINNFNGPVAAFQQHTQNSVQNVRQDVSINPDFNSAIEGIIDLIRNSNVPSYLKDDLVSEAQKIQRLQHEEPSAALIEHAKAKILSFENALKVADLSVKLAQYTPQLYTFFDALLKGSSS